MCSITPSKAALLCPRKYALAALDQRGSTKFRKNLVTFINYIWEVQKDSTIDIVFSSLRICGDYNKAQHCVWLGWLY